MGFANRDTKGWDSREGYRNQKWDVFGWIPDDWSGNKNDKVTKEEPKDNKLTGETELSKPKPDLRRNKGTINYPSNAPQNRDYLCIKAIEYITPKSRGAGKEFGSGGGLQVKTNEIETLINISDNKITYLDREFIKLASIFGVIANIRLIIFLKQN